MLPVILLKVKRSSYNINFIHSLSELSTNKNFSGTLYESVSYEFALYGGLLYFLNNLEYAI